MDPPLAIDVVVLNIDRPDDVHECIDSILQQDHPGVRLFVIDQGSQARTASGLRERAARDGFVFRETENLGVAGGRNLGSSLGQAPIIVALDNDAVLASPGELGRVADAFAGDSRLGALALAVHDYHHGGPDPSTWSYPWPAETHFRQGFATARFVGAGHAIRRAAFEQVGGYDTEFFFFGEELDLCFALVAAGYFIRYEPGIVVRHKASLEQRVEWDTGRYYHNVRNMLYLNHKHIGRRWLNFQYAAGFLAKGLVNGYAGQALRGIRDGMRLNRAHREPPTLSGKALDYVMRHEFQPRGSALRRLLDEVLIRMRTSGGRP